MCVRFCRNLLILRGVGSSPTGVIGYLQDFCFSHFCLHDNFWHQSKESRIYGQICYGSTVIVCPTGKTVKASSATPDFSLANAKSTGGLLSGMSKARALMDKLTRLIAHKPCTPVHTDRTLDAHLDGHTHRPFWICVLEVHMPPRLIRAYRDGGEVNRTQDASDSCEQGGRKAGVAEMHKRLGFRRVGADVEAGPKSCVGIFWRACRPVLTVSSGCQALVS